MTTNWYLVVWFAGVMDVSLIMVVVYLVLKNDALRREVDALDRGVMKMRSYIHKRDVAGWTEAVLEQDLAMSETREFLLEDLYKTTVLPESLDTGEIRSHARRSRPRPR